MWWYLFLCLNYEYPFFFLLVGEYIPVPCSVSLKYSTSGCSHCSQSISTCRAIFGMSGRSVYCIIVMMYGKYPCHWLLSNMSCILTGYVRRSHYCLVSIFYNCLIWKNSPPRFCNSYAFTFSESPISAFSFQAVF